MNNTEFVSALNEYSFSGENDKILRILNALFDSGEYKTIFYKGIMPSERI